MRLCLLALAAVLLASCTTTQKIIRPGGKVEYLVACGASTRWNIRYERANELYPGGYETVSEQGGFNRTELRISCPNAGK